MASQDPLSAVFITVFLSSASDLIVAILSSYVVRAKLCPLHRKVGSKKCVKSRCEACDYHILGNTGEIANGFRYR